MNADYDWNMPAESPRLGSSPLCAVLSLALPMAGYYFGTHGFNVAERAADMRQLLAYAGCVGGTLMLGLALAVVSFLRSEPVLARGLVAGVYAALCLRLLLHL